VRGMPGLRISIPLPLPSKQWQEQEIFLSGRTAPSISTFYPTALPHPCMLHIVTLRTSVLCRSKLLNQAAFVLL
jgi:hypothetical protein